MEHPKRILVVDDDAELRQMIEEYLCAEGFDIQIATDGRAGLEAVTTRAPDLVLLDVMLPVLNGLDTIREIRKHSRVPVIMLTAKGGGADRIVGLELGADDYIAKPFDPRELLARIRAVLRRADPSPTTSLLKADDLVLRPESRSAYLKGEEIELTSFEFDVVSILVSRLGQVVSRHELSAQLGRQLLPLDRSIDMHIVSLRRKLGPSPLGRDRIKTVRGTGYMFVPDGARG